MHEDHLKLALRENPDHFVLHVGTNELDSDRSPDPTAKSIVDVASSLETDKHEVTILSIITRNDRFMGKANEANKRLIELCFEKTFLLVGHSNILKSQHLNESKLRLNRRGIPILQIQNTFTKVLSNILVNILSP